MACTLSRRKRELNLSQPSDSLSYRDAGVDIDAGDRLVENIKPFAKRTMRPEVLGNLGGFGALVEISKKYKEPVLVSGTDGVGTKLKLAVESGRHDDIGIDLVAMCANDLLVQGAEPLFFLDYYVCESLDVDVAERVIAGIARGCEIAGCALIGGETAEHPSAFPPGEYDLAGFCVGMVERTGLISGADIAPGDAVIGLASSGPHANGYSLIRRLLRETGTQLEQDFDGKSTFADALLCPTVIYVRPVLQLLARHAVRGMAHITGGGLVENIPRVLPDSAQAQIDLSSWKQPGIFRWLQDAGGLDERELYRTFNCGVGYVLIVADEDAQAVIEELGAAGLDAWHMGVMGARREGDPPIILSGE